jgi:hypothetical protein
LENPCLLPPSSGKDWGIFGSAEGGYAKIFEQIDFHPDRIIYTDDKYRPHEISILGFDLKMNPSHSGKIDKSSIKGAVCIAFIQLNANVYWFYTVLNRKGDKMQLFANRISLKEVKFVGPAIFLAEMDKNSKPQLNRSADKNKLLVTYFAGANDKETDSKPTTLGVFSFNDQLKKIRGGEHPLSTEAGDNLNFYQNLVGNDGTPYMLLEKGDPDRGRAKLKTWIFRTDDGPPSEIPVDIQLGPIQSIKLLEDPAGTIMLLGYCRQKATIIINGLFIFKLNTESNQFDPIKKGFYEIPPEFSLSYETRTAKKRSGLGKQHGILDYLRLNFLEVTEVFYLQDGSMTVIGESRMNYTTNSEHFSFSSTNYSDILIVHLKTNGELGWIKKIPKLQPIAFGVDGTDLPPCYGSYRALFNGTTLRIVFVNDPVNDNRADSKAPAAFGSGKANLYCFAYDEIGNETKSLLGKIKNKSQDLVDLHEGLILDGRSILGSSRYTRKGYHLSLIEVY